MRRRHTHAYDLRRHVLLRAGWWPSNMSGYECRSCGEPLRGWYWAKHAGNGYDTVCGNLLSDCYPNVNGLRSAIRRLANELEVHESVVVERALLKGTTRRLAKALDELHAGPNDQRTHGEVKFYVE